MKNQRTCPNRAKTIVLIIVLTVLILPTLFNRAYLSFSYAHPFYRKTAEEILKMDHYDMGTEGYQLEYGGRTYRDIPVEEFPYPLTEDHYSEYKIVQVVSFDSAAGYVLLCHRDDVRLEYLLCIPDKGPESYQILGTIKRPLGSFMKANQMPLPPTSEDEINDLLFNLDLTEEELIIHENNITVLSNSISYKNESIVEEISELMIRLTRTGLASNCEIRFAERRIAPTREK